MEILTTSAGTMNIGNAADEDLLSNGGLLTSFRRYHEYCR
jgi:hypothetical protein